MRARIVGALVLTLVAIGLLVPRPGRTAVSEVSDTIDVFRADLHSNAEVAVRLSEETFAASVDTVLIGRDDLFADSLASGILQADAPLLLVPPAGAIPPAVLAELDRLAPATAILLGGEGALSPAVADEIADRGIAVERRAGATRFETAAAIAGAAVPEADTVIIVRAFAEAGGDQTQAFADALAAGGLAAEMSWPVLLTEPETLTASSADYLAASQAVNAW